MLNKNVMRMNYRAAKIQNRKTNFKTRTKYRTQSAFCFDAQFSVKVSTFQMLNQNQQIQLAKCSGNFSVQRLWKYFHLITEWNEGDNNGYLNLSTMRR